MCARAHASPNTHHLFIGRSYRTCKRDELYKLVSLQFSFTASNVTGVGVGVVGVLNGGIESRNTGSRSLQRTRKAYHETKPVASYLIH